ncbi:hypothetical protein NESM_000803300 [Novymonas esmeraldas]|uniref:Centromere protein J C-terminal domain-containing protein n=1 Tax=Novymonas esmeraldas TaxID=1808958 RepID=A0AAW0EZW3_9TRYP
MLRGRSGCLKMRVDMAAAELRRLVPLLPTSKVASSGASQSIASLIVSTSFSATAARSAANHARDCPVLAKTLPLSQISKERSFVERPCVTCVRERVHYVSSASFCDDFGRRCVGTANARPLEAAALPAGVLQAVERSYGSVSALNDTVVLHAAGAMGPGRLWIVYAPPKSTEAHGAMRVLSLPACRVPLVHGLWPLAVIDMTEGRLCGEVARRWNNDDEAAEEDSPPSWSRAGRSPAALGSVATVTRTAHRQPSMARIRLPALQGAVAEEAMRSMNWQFVETQLTAALDYYSSQQRTRTQEEHRKKCEQVAAVRAMEQVKDSGAVLRATDSVTITSSGTAGASSAVRNVTTLPAASTTSSASPDTGSAAHGETGSRTAEATDGHTEGSVGSAASETGPAADSATPGIAVPTAAAADTTEPRSVQQADGTWEYHYNNGDVTRVYANGTKVFLTESLTTTVFTNGDTLFEYPDKTTILDRVDGVRVKTFADGTRKEERLR